VKLKFNVKGSWGWSKPFIDLLQGRQDEIILRADEQLKYIADAADAALKLEGADKEMLESLKKILEKKIGIAGTKAQLKPSFSTNEDGESVCEKLNIIVKWGGEFTHAGRYQSRDLGENMRKDYAILNKYICLIAAYHVQILMRIDDQDSLKQCFHLQQFRVSTQYRRFHCCSADLAPSSGAVLSPLPRSSEALS